MSVTIGIIAIKGGVGKTTISASLATDLANRYGKRILLIDANYSAPNLGLHMDILDPDKTLHEVLVGNLRIESAIQNKFGVDVIPGSYVFEKDLNVLKLKDKLAKIKENYDFVILDSSPSLNEEVLSTMLASDKLFVVSTPDYPTLSCSLKAARLAKQRGKPISGVIVNKVRDPSYELTLEEIEESVGIPVIARIPDDVSAGRAIYTRIPVSVYHGRTKFSKEIAKLGAALIGIPERRSMFRRLFSSEFKREEVNRQLLKNNFYSRSFG